MVREILTLRSFSAILLQVGRNTNISILIYDVSNTWRIAQGSGYREGTSDCFSVPSCVRSQPARAGGDGSSFFPTPSGGSQLTLTSLFHISHSRYSIGKSPPCVPEASAPFPMMKRVITIPSSKCQLSEIINIKHSGEHPGGGEMNSEIL